MSTLFFLYLEYRGSAQVSVDVAYLEADIITVKAEVSSTVTSSNAEIGVTVKKSQEVITLDDTEWKKELAALKSNINQAKSKLNISKMEIDVLQKRLLTIEEQSDEVSEFISIAKKKHTMSLDALSSNAISVDDTYTKALLLPPLYESLYDTKMATSETEQAIIQNREKQEMAIDNIAHYKTAIYLLDSLKNRYHIYTPPHSVIVSINAFEGSVVQKGDTLLKYILPNNYFVTAYFSETDIGKLEKDKPVNVEFDAFPGAVYTGNITFISPAGGAHASPVSPNYTSGYVTRVIQRIPVRISIDYNEHPFPLSLGMSAKVTQNNEI